MKNLHSCPNTEESDRVTIGRNARDRRCNAVGTVLAPSTGKPSSADLCLKKPKFNAV
jgi:hypothetical protein